MAIGEVERLEREFAALNIDIRRPGFCNSAQFIAGEQAAAGLLHRYARYIRLRTYDDAYRDRVRGRLPQMVTFLSEELARDGRLGACIDISMVLSKFLALEDIWSYCAVGSLVVRFNPPGRTQTLHHFMQPGNPARAGHAWLVVPPFDIVDATVQAQPGFTEGERQQLHPVVKERAEVDDQIAVDEMAEPELLALFERDYGRPGRLEDFAMAGLRGFWRESPPKVITTPTARLKYVECGPMADDDTPLERMRNLVLSAQGPGELHTVFLNRFPRA